MSEHQNPFSSPVPSPPSPEVMHSFRRQLTVGEDVVDVAKWYPAAYGTAPHVRVWRSRWFNLLLLLPLGFVGLISVVAIGQGLRKVPSVEQFIARYPGTVMSADAPAGFPAWVGVQHFFNLFLMMFIIRSGMQILADHPRLYWTRHCTPGREWFRFQTKVPDEGSWTARQDSVTLPGQIGLPGLRHSIGLARWWHLGVNTLWLLNGLVFYVLLLTTGHWRRVVPTSWDVFPNALSVLIQYLSLQWPAEHGWVAYNSLQLFAYFITIFIAAPAALITGMGMSPALSTRFKRLSRVLSIQTARSLHFLVFVWFLIFLVTHVALVFTTSLRENLNHMYAGRDDDSWIGFTVFALTMVVVVVGWTAATPFTLRHPRLVQRAGFALVGPAQRLFEHVDSSAGEYTERDISPYFWHNGKLPDSEEYTRVAANNFADYRLRINGLVENPRDLSLAELRALPQHEQITQHFCIQGWSGVAKWGGVSMQTLIDLARPKPEAKWVVFYSLGGTPEGGIYYDVHAIEQMSHQLTMLAYDMNAKPLAFEYGAPLRLRNETQLGFRQVKWVKGVEFVADFADIGGGYGGYNEDHEFFGYRQSI